MVGVRPDEIIGNLGGLGRGVGDTGHSPLEAISQLEVTRTGWIHVE